MVGIASDRFASDDEFMRHLAQVVRNGLGDRAGTCIDPKTQAVKGKTVCLGACRRKNLLREQIPSPGLSRYSV